MTLEEECRLSYYKEIAVLSEEHGVFVVQHLSTKRIFVKKVLTTYDKRVYLYLKDHPIANTPAVYEVMEDENRLIVIEEYAVGQSLEEWLEKEGPFSEEATVKIIYQLAHILKDLHTVKPPIIHRDIKPSNILLTRDFRVTLLDMDAAKVYHEAAQDTRLIGTFGYAAPEQYGFGPSTVQTDIYSLGVLMNVLLTGRFPNEQTASGGLSKILQKCLKMDPAKRYQSMEELIEALDRKVIALGGEEPLPLGREDYLPGFRSRDPVKNILAGLGYGLLLYLSMMIEIPDATGIKLWGYRALAFFTILAIILFGGNYRGIQDRLGITKLKSSKGQMAVILLVDILIVVVILLFMMAMLNR